MVAATQHTSGLCIVTLLVLGALFCVIVGISTTGWYMVNLPRGEGEEVKRQMELGLWEVCVCNQPAATPDFMRATQALTILTLIILIITNILVGWMFCLADSPKRLILCAVLAMLVVSAIFLLAAVCVYGSEIGKDTDVGGLSYSFAFVVIAMIICFVGSGMTFMEWRMN